MKIDVVIPIFNAYEALKECLSSVEKHQQGAEQIILINDASSDQRIEALVEKVAVKNNWKLIHHKKNLGFVATANEGLMFSDNNTLLLNSDTVVSKHWLTAFKQAIESNPQLATATAWSNNAEICSFPQFLSNNQNPEDIDQFTEVLFRNHQPQYPVIPTAVGFCMLITAKAQKIVGLFDRQQFGHGYGEENDYSLRAIKKGLINVVCDNAYVAHKGNESFADLGLQPNQDSMNRLLEKHPDYQQLIGAFIKQDPLAEIRAQIMSTIKKFHPDVHNQLISNNEKKTENNVMEKQQLDFTGERFTPECVREIWYEHYHRYAYAQRVVKDKVVLDAACGEGYGSHLLSQRAKKVNGIDIDEKSIEHCQKRYHKNNLSFQQASCTDLPFDTDAFDVIVSFETLEHLAEQEQMLAEFDRVLKPNGVLLISKPDKKHYSDATGFDNEYHVKELYQHEFKQLLDQHWPYQTWYAQSMAFYSMMEKMGAQDKHYATDILCDEAILADQEILKPMYYVVIVSKHKKHLPQGPDLHLFADQEQSVYEHYNQTIRDYISVAEKYMAMKDKHEKWLSHPILGKIIKFLERGK